MLTRAFEHVKEKVADLVAWGAMKFAYSYGASTEPPPPPPEKPQHHYLDMGEGKCRNIHDTTPKFKFYPNVSEGWIKEKCREIPGCGGYSWSWSVGGGFMYMESGLFGGGYGWPGNCMIFPGNQGTGQPAKPPGVYFESLGVGNCIRPDRSDRKFKSKPVTGNETQVEKMCLEDHDCTGFIYLKNRPWIQDKPWLRYHLRGYLYYEGDLIGGGGDWYGCECTMKRYGTPPQ